MPAIIISKNAQKEFSHFPEKDKKKVFRKINSLKKLHSLKKC